MKRYIGTQNECCIKLELCYHKPRNKLGERPRSYPRRIFTDPNDNLISDFCYSELWDSKFLLFAQFMILCYDSPRK